MYKNLKKLILETEDFRVSAVTGYSDLEEKQVLPDFCFIVCQVSLSFILMSYHHITTCQGTTKRTLLIKYVEGKKLQFWFF